MEIPSYRDDLKTTSKTEGTPIFEMGGKQVSDYYLFGMFRDACFSSNEKLSRTNLDKARGAADGLSGQMPGRHGSDNSEGEYRYGFQRQEVDGEIKGEGNSVNYKYRMHCSSRLYGNPRVGRFFAVDPLASKYPHNSPYAFSENRVIDPIELKGLERFLIKDHPSVPNIKILLVTNKDVEFEVIDEQGNVLNHFKYKSLEYQMEGWEPLPNGGIRVPNASKNNLTAGDYDESTLITPVRTRIGGRFMLGANYFITENIAIGSYLFILDYNDGANGVFNGAVSILLDK